VISEDYWQMATYSFGLGTNGWGTINALLFKASRIAERFNFHWGVEAS
jgi:hypothetical protein